jgi:hypothetical protein
LGGAVAFIQKEEKATHVKVMRKSREVACGAEERKNGKTGKA